MDKKYKLLKEQFGHDSFRRFQEQAVDTILQNKDLLTILPTGGGKSLCYQLPTLLMDGLTVVITPLIALMQDQVAALKANGISAAMASSHQDTQTLKSIYAQVHQNRLKFLYVAPERLNPNFLSMLSSVKLNFFVIDEAHCLSEWGHEFRSDYRKLGILKQTFPNTPVAAFTATATKKVEQDIINVLSLQNVTPIRAKTIRDNLEIHVRLRNGNGREQIVRFLKDFKNERGIIYTYTRKEAQELSEFLVAQGFNAMYYHAGMDNKSKEVVHDAFFHDSVDIVVATIAFGMGIDKSNICYVIHTSMPKTLEGYYQEIGRAGRDGVKSYALMLYKKSDEAVKKSLIHEGQNTHVQTLALQKLKATATFCTSSSCRHRIIANYFDDEVAPCENLCDNCLKGEIEEVDVTVEAQKLLSCIYRTGERFGANYVIDVLRGSKIKRIIDFGHDKLSVYGVGKETTKANFEAVLDRLLEVQCLTIGEFSSLKLLPKSVALLKGKEKLFIDKDKMTQKTSYKVEQKSDEFEALRMLRLEIAKKEGIAAFMVFGDKTLLEMSIVLPGTEEKMLEISGVGAVKYEKYGKAFLQKCIELKR